MEDEMIHPESSLAHCLRIRHLPQELNQNYLFQGSFAFFKSEIFEKLFSYFDQNENRTLRLVNRNFAFQVVETNTKQFEFTKLQKMLAGLNKLLDDGRINLLTVYLEPQDFIFDHLHLLQEYLTTVKSAVIHVLKEIDQKKLKKINRSLLRKKHGFPLLKIVHIAGMLQKCPSKADMDLIVYNSYHSPLKTSIYFQMVQDKTLLLIRKKKSLEAIKLMNTLQSRQQFLNLFTKSVRLLISKQDFYTAISLTADVFNLEDRIMIFSNEIIPSMSKKYPLDKAFSTLLEAIYNLEEIEARNELYLVLIDHLRANAHFSEAQEITKLMKEEELEISLFKWLKEPHSIKIDKQLRHLGNLGVLPLDVISMIFGSFSARDMESCALLNRNWNYLTAQIVGTSEIVIFQNTMVSFYKALNQIEATKWLTSTHALMHHRFPSTFTSLMHVLQEVCSKTDRFLADLQSIGLDNFEKLTPLLANLDTSLCFGNLKEVLEVEVKHTVFPFTSNKSPWIDTLFKNSYFSRFPYILTKLQNDERMQMWEYILKKYIEIGYKKKAKEIIPQFSKRDILNFYNLKFVAHRTVEKFIYEGKLDEAILAVTVTKSYDAFLLLSTALWKAKRTQEIVPLYEKIFPYLEDKLHADLLKTLNEENLQSVFPKRKKRNTI